MGFLIYVLNELKETASIFSYRKIFIQIAFNLSISNIFYTNTDIKG